MTQNREEYLQQVANDYGVNLYVVSSLAEILGENEDYDGLISAMDDYCDLDLGDWD